MFLIFSLGISVHIKLKNFISLIKNLLWCNDIVGAYKTLSFYCAPGEQIWYLKRPHRDITVGHLALYVRTASAMV